ncbi:hypothetical protein J3A83DRAFT_1435486 [Scleroderma citrinum]
MLPITEFQFAFCGIATVAATLGYAYSRKAAHPPPLSAVQPTANDEVGSSEERSLKRKLDDSDNCEPCADQQERPMKRSKTPPTEQQCNDEDEWEVIVAPPSYEEAIAPQRKHTPEPLYSCGQNDTAPVSDVTTIHEKIPEPEVPPTQKTVTSAKPSEAEQASQPSSTQNKVESKPEPPVTPPRKPTEIKTPRGFNAFSAFSGSSSPFASYSNPNGTSPFGIVSQKENASPAWRRTKDYTEIIDDSSSQTTARSPNDVTSTITEETSTALQSTKLPAKKPESHVTGEEDETITAELKAAKLFIKRGKKEFTNGMYGHIKILSLKPDLSEKEMHEGVGGAQSRTKSNAKVRTRLLFRRDPLGQVTMNVALRPTVRCHFDEAENILRVILKEQVTTDKETKEDIIVYALKPGRAMKADFRTFAEAVCCDEQLKDTPPPTVENNATTS